MLAVSAAVIEILVVLSSVDAMRTVALTLQDLFTYMFYITNIYIFLNVECLKYTTPPPFFCTFGEPQLNYEGLFLSRIKKVWMRTVRNERPVFILNADAKVELIKQFIFLDGETVNNSNKTKSNNQQKHFDHFPSSWKRHSTT